MTILGMLIGLTPISASGDSRGRAPVPQGSRPTAQLAPGFDAYSGGPVPQGSRPTAQLAPGFDAFSGGPVPQGSPHTAQASGLLTREQYYEVMGNVRTALDKLKRRSRALELIIGQEESQKASDSRGFFSFGRGEKKTILPSWEGRKGETLALINESIQELKETQERLIMVTHQGHGLGLMDLPDTRGWTTAPQDELKRMLALVILNTTRVSEMLLSAEERLRAGK